MTAETFDLICIGGGSGGKTCGGLRGVGRPTAALRRMR